MNKKCVTCNYILDISEFSIKRGRKTLQYHSRCNRCSNTMKYGLSRADYDNLVIEQNGCCKICKDVLGTGRQAHIDHSHKTGKVRGILCTHCNRLLGAARDNKDILAASIKYLEQCDSNHSPFTRNEI